MLAKHRQSLILQDVRRTGSARVSDLTERLGVSDMTIRRDLEVLARAGLIEKVHGGAVLPGVPSSHEPGFEAKSVLERPELARFERMRDVLSRQADVAGAQAKPRVGKPPGRHRSKVRDGRLRCVARD